MSATPVAAFDFDGTLSRRDTLFGFLRFACGETALMGALARTVPTVVRSRAGRRTGGPELRDAGKERLLHALFRGREESWLHERGEAWGRRLPPKLRPDMLRRLSWHRERGHRLIIVSASLQTYLDHIGAELGFDEVIGVRLEAEGGVLTGRLVGPNVRGPEKEVRLRGLLADSEHGPIWAYGNSSGDRELLAMADHPLLVGRAEVPTAPDAPVHPEAPDPAPSISQPSDRDRRDEADPVPEPDPA